jgi:hypothetical protein
VLKLKGNDLAEKHAEKILLAKEVNGGSTAKNAFTTNLENGRITPPWGTYKVLIDKSLP